jgi:DNA-binding PadR family transcriptional regulator
MFEGPTPTRKLFTRTELFLLALITKQHSITAVTIRQEVNNNPHARGVTQEVLRLLAGMETKGLIVHSHHPVEGAGITAKHYSPTGPGLEVLAAAQKAVKK